MRVMRRNAASYLRLGDIEINLFERGPSDNRPVEQERIKEITTEQLMEDPFYGIPTV